MGTDYTREPVCPYCGHVERDAWEIDFGNSEIAEFDCGSCGKTMVVIQSITVYYSTRKAEGRK